MENKGQQLWLVDFVRYYDNGQMIVAAETSNVARQLCEKYYKYEHCDVLLVEKMDGCYSNKEYNKVIKTNRIL